MKMPHRLRFVRVPAIDSGLYTSKDGLDWSWNEALATQKERAAQAARVAREFYALPYVVGAHWFTWQDFESPRRRANRGLYRASGKPWKVLLDRLGRVQAGFAPR